MLSEMLLLKCIDDVASLKVHIENTTYLPLQYFDGETFKEYSRVREAQFDRIKKIEKQLLQLVLY